MMARRVPVRIRGTRRLFAFTGTLAIAATLALATSQAFAQAVTGLVPEGTRIRFHLLEPVSSDKSRTGGTFGFVLLEPIVANGQTIPVDGTSGAGTIVLAGHAGNQGHEGDLTLRIDSLRTADGRYVAFDNQQFKINGRNRKIASAALGFVPFVGYASFLIRGSEVHVDPAEPVETVLTRDAAVGIGPPPATPSPLASGSAMPAASASAAPSAGVPSSTATVPPAIAAPSPSALAAPSSSPAAAPAPSGTAPPA